MFCRPFKTLRPSLISSLTHVNPHKVRVNPRCYGKNEHRLFEKRLFWNNKIAEFTASADAGGIVRFGGAFGSVGSAFSAWYGWYLTKKSWQTRIFHRRVMLSLNCLDGDILRLRTLFEKDLHDIVINNDHLIGIILHAAKETTSKQSFLRLPEKDVWHILNMILNCISELSAEGHIARDMGLPTKSEWYIFGLTCEKHATYVRNQKLRLLLIKEATLERIDQEMDIKVELPHHVYRIQTLKEMATIYREQLRGGSRILMKVELCFPMTSSHLHKPFPM